MGLMVMADLGRDLGQQVPLMCAKCPKMRVLASAEREVLYDACIFRLQARCMTPDHCLEVRDRYENVPLLRLREVNVEVAIDGTAILASDYDNYRIQHAVESYKKVILGRFWFFGEAPEFGHQQFNILAIKRVSEASSS